MQYSLMNEQDEIFINSLVSNDCIIKRLDCLVNLMPTHPNAILPTQAHSGDNCWDIYAVEDISIPASTSVTGGNVDIGNAVVPVGLKVAFITEGFGLVIKGRSGMGFKSGIFPHFGEIDNSYRGDISCKLYNTTSKSYQVKRGDRIAQLKVEKVYSTQFNLVDKVTDTARGEGGFGSSGK